MESKRFFLKIAPKKFLRCYFRQRNTSGFIDRVTHVSDYKELTLANLTKIRGIVISVNDNRFLIKMSIREKNYKCLKVVLLTIFTFLTLSINAQTSKNDWAGNYEFFDGQNGPRNRPSDFINYSLNLSQSNKDLDCKFAADGTQTSDEYECSVQISGDSIKILFVKDLNGMNESRFEPFKKGQLLFTLTKTQIGRKIKYLFRAGKYEILPLSAVSKNKIYFTKK